MLADIEKRVNILFDLLNCGTLSEPTQARILEICRGEWTDVVGPADPSQRSRGGTSRQRSSCISRCLRRARQRR